MLDSRTPIFGALLSISLLALPALPQARDPLPVPDLPGLKTLKCDFHTHTVFSDGDVWPTTRIAEAWRDGLDVIALTDHAGYNPHEKDVPVNLARPPALAKELADWWGLLVIPGAEVAEGDIHYNALFLADPNALRGVDLAEALRRAKAQHAFVFWNHPGWKQTPEWFPLVASLHREGLFQGIELVNGTTFYREAFPWVEEHGLAIVANSDVHAPVPVDYAPRSRPITLVFASSASLTGVREALFAHRTSAWVNGQVWGDERYLRGLWEGAVKVEGAFQGKHEGDTVAVLRLRNHSAIPFDLRAGKGPAWLRVTPVELPAERIAGLWLQVAANAPTGPQRVEIELEVANLHTEPARNLTVRLLVDLKLGN